MLDAKDVKIYADLDRIHINLWPSNDKPKTLQRAIQFRQIKWLC